MTGKECDARFLEFNVGSEKSLTLTLPWTRVFSTILSQAQYDCLISCGLHNEHITKVEICADATSSCFKIISLKTWASLWTD